MSLPSCSCGYADNHVVARTTTLDGVFVSRWHDGSITGALGVWPPGIARTRYASQQLAVAALVWPSLSLYDWTELPNLIKTARRAVTQKSLQPADYLRRALSGEKFRTVARGVVVGLRPGGSRPPLAGTSGLSPPTPAPDRKG